jgi:Rap1a immunity proteins
MRNPKSYCLIPALLAMSVGAHGDTLTGFPTGNDWLAHCEVPPSSYEEGVCDGYLTAAIEVRQAAFGSSPVPFCMESKVTRGQVRAVFEKFISDHPEKRNQLVIGLVWQSLTQAWPSHGKTCK